MALADLVVETLPGKARVVAERLTRMKGMGSIDGDGDHRITARWEVPDHDELEGLAEALRAMNPEIVEVVPTPVSTD